METLDFLKRLDVKLGRTLVIKPHWEIAKSVHKGIESKTVQRGSDPVSFLVALCTRGNSDTVVSTQFTLIQSTSCCTTLTLTGKDVHGKEVTRVNFNLRIRQKTIPIRES